MSRRLITFTPQQQAEAREILTQVEQPEPATFRALVNPWLWVAAFVAWGLVMIGFTLLANPVALIVTGIVGWVALTVWKLLEPDQ